jgi:Domain of Unknown Function with PDB structure (DUF3857)/Transglutaminase-like superfamily
MKSLLFGLIFTFFIAVPAIFAGNDIPDWLRQDAAITTPVYEKNVPGVVLRNNQSVEYTADGRIVVTTTYSVRILVREGKNLALADAVYLVSSGKVKEINAWMISANGIGKKYDKDYIVDQVTDIDDIYNEYRVKIIDASREADAGCVFGYQTVSEARPLFTQDIWMFQGRLPTINSRYSLTIPKGWKATNTTFNHADIQPQINGNTYSWELNNLSGIPRETSSPSILNLAPRIAVNYFAESGTTPAYKDWTEVSRWMTSMHDGQTIVDDAVASKARELTASSTTELEKIQAIGTFVQNLQYISIDIGVGYGNGYKPRPSNLVLNRGYGDCKDKANLMRALLKSLKIEAYPIAIYSGDPTFTREEWASPRQFNHCIIAVKVSDETKTATVINHPKLGRLLIFDATDSYTPVGDLPEYLQGSFALIAAGDQGGLFKMPVTSPEANSLDRKIEVNLTATGAISGTINEKASGQMSTEFRSQYRLMKTAEYQQMIDGWLTYGATGAKATKITSTDFNADAKFNLDVEFNAANYGQLMQNRLLVFKPVIVGRRETVKFTETTRKHPILIDSTLFNETVTFTLPQGFTVDELPNAVKLEASFGKYSTNYEVKDGKLIFTRSYRLSQTIVSPENYKSVKDFYSKISEAEQSPVVLIKK